jgi:hypothetical protein
MIESFLKRTQAVKILSPQIFSTILLKSSMQQKPALCCPTLHAPEPQQRALGPWWWEFARQKGVHYAEANSVKAALSHPAHQRVPLSPDGDLRQGAHLHCTERSAVQVT